MDTSQSYIRMCEKAPEIQGEFFGYINSWFACRRPDGIAVVLTDEFSKPIPGHISWLPRQDQLQEMVGCETVCVFKHDLEDKFLDIDNTGARLHIPKWIKPDWSMEQFWLAVVMETNYNKVWDEKGWVKADGNG